MGSRYVVFVDETLVLGSVQMAAATAGVSTGRGEGNFQLGVAQELELRREVLTGLAAALTGQTGPSASAGFASSAIVAMADVAETMQALPEGTEILEGISAIVVDENDIDLAALETVIGLTILPNIEVKLPGPVAATTAAGGIGWHLNRIGLGGGAPGGDGILIGILDTGIDDTHSEFFGKTVHFAEFDSTGQLISTVARDAGDHGTHVSSIAAGRQAGVAPDADLAVAAVLTARDPFGRMSGTLVQIAKGFNWLVTTRFGERAPGVDLINASLGGSGFNTYLQIPVRTALRLGVPLFAAAGNNGRGGAGRHGSPANYPEAFGVGASDPADVVADFSDWGVSPPPIGPAYPVPEVCAPGVQVHAAKPGGGMQPMSGTSMASPVVAGVAARRMQANSALVGNPAALFADLRTRLAPCSPHPLGNLGGAGRIMA